MTYAIFTYSNYREYQTTARCKILFEVEEIINNNEEPNTLHEILAYIREKTKTKEFIIKRLVSSEIPDWVFKYLKFEETEDDTFGKCVQITHKNSNRVTKKFVYNSYSDGNNVIFEASDDKSAELLMECVSE